MQALMRKPSGFKEPAYYESPVTVHGYCYGNHMDARGYDKPAQCTLAIIEQESGPLVAVPLNWIFPLANHPDTGS